MKLSDALAKILKFEEFGVQIRNILEDSSEFRETLSEPM